MNDIQWQWALFSVAVHILGFLLVISDLFKGVLGSS